MKNKQEVIDKRTANILKTAMELKMFVNRYNEGMVKEIDGLPIDDGLIIYDRIAPLIRGEFPDRLIVFAKLVFAHIYKDWRGKAEWRGDHLSLGNIKTIEEVEKYLSEQQQD